MMMEGDESISTPGQYLYFEELDLKFHDWSNLLFLIFILKILIPSHSLGPPCAYLSEMQPFDIIHQILQAA